MEAREVNSLNGEKTKSKEAIRFQKQEERIRKRFLKYTRKAFRMLPKLDNPRILDVGCGSGIPTMELARLSNGEIIGLDIDQSALDTLAEKIIQADLSDRVKTMRRSVINMEFPAESFDIIWSEGSIFPVGFEKGLQEWKRFLKPGGYMAVHDGKGNITEKLKQISSCGYELLSHFVLSTDIWRDEYLAPLERLVRETRDKYGDNPGILEALNDAQREIDMFNHNPELNDSVFFILKKK